ncbi:hypothetical protein [Streptantibioticus silvisoli]|uniref:Uncharacterized protein n=1 Tax=Streptantibioticus silvisoli TaxID=2705255 RepID=A0ABT6VY80_9ACTN|nr:hypothetical protein [Streptantibioticus silvisoli]MDI5962418.1 hypothetical protein [Streptantibioticus silvisoli]
MNVWKLVRNAAVPVVCGITASVAVGAFCGNASAATGHGPATAIHSAAAPKALSRQLLGQVSGPTYLEASAPVAGVYAVEYDVTGNAAFDTYIDGTELGYVGASPGVYQTRSVSLSAGGHLVQVAGPEGSGQASVYLVQIS